ncbi:PLP-dependent aminotransferase family protein [Kribbella sp. NPDC051952]|uniref:aminotransferase-like domain-containing protein n=1 Tax=Kribbella sp. NPDC051952 TaxID=3154851 RepID=UPI003431836C
MTQAYREIADLVAADIAAGRLRAGERLPTQRRFARDRGIAASTASRVYGELVRRGLVVGEVGRGTFVRTAEPATEALAEPARAGVDLELNFPILPGQAELLAPSLEGLLRPDALATALRPATVTGTKEAREAAATLLTRPHWSPGAEHVVFAGNGRQALAAAVATLVGPGERLGVEALTYPVMKGIAGRLGVTLVPLAMDDHGVEPTAVRAAGVRAVYLQPTVHNPLGITMPEHRRAELAAVLADLDLVAIEDMVNGFLEPAVTPLAALAPDHTILVDSLTKRLAPGLTAGFLVAPRRLVGGLSSAVRSGGWTAPAFALAAATRWIADGAVATIVRAKLDDAQARQRLAAERLAGLTVKVNPRAYHLWWSLPAPWRAETFVGAAARRGIAVTPAAAFTVGPGQAPNAVRLALASPPIEILDQALETLVELARSTPDDTDHE